MEYQIQNTVFHTQLQNAQLIERFKRFKVIPLEFKHGNEIAIDDIGYLNLKLPDSLVANIHKNVWQG
jgi:hypothetical protein